MRHGLIPRQLGQRLLNQQCWCWGCDIRHSAGNLLLDYGCERVRPPERRQGSSVYTWRDSSTTVVLWGWGLWYSRGGPQQLYLARYDVRPQLMELLQPPSTVWAMDDLPEARLPQEHEQQQAGALLCGACRWIVAYERWIHQTVGIDYRAECLQRWNKRSMGAIELCEHWLNLAQRASQARKL